MSNKSSPIPRSTTDCRDRIADRYDASFAMCQSDLFSIMRLACVYLAMRKAMEDSAVLSKFTFYNNISIATSGCSCNNILIEWKGYKYDDSEKIDYSTNSSHSFWATLHN